MKGSSRAGAAARALERLHRFYVENPGESREDDALLSHVLEHSLCDTSICSADLVRSRLFGALPDVSRRLTRLMDRGLLQQVADSGRQSRRLEVTQRGIDLLEQRWYLVAPRDTAEGP